MQFVARANLLLKLEGSPLVNARSARADLDMSLDGGGSDKAEAPAERAQGMSSRVEPEAPSEPADAFSDAAQRGGVGVGANSEESLEFSGGQMDMETTALGALVRERLLKRHRHSPYEVLVFTTDSGRMWLLLASTMRAPGQILLPEPKHYCLE